MSMTKNRIFGRAAMVTFMIAAISSMALFGAACKDRAAYTDRAACGGFVGSYVTTFTDQEGVFSSRGVMTFTSDGVLLVSDSAQGGIPGVWDPFSSAQGTWKCLSEEGGKLSIRAVGLNFVLPADGRTPRFGRVDYEASLDTGTGTLSGSATLRLTSENDLEGADPVTEPGAEVDAFNFDGERVVIKD
jgi:hypothetical protein